MFPDGSVPHCIQLLETFTVLLRQFYFEFGVICTVVLDQ